MSTIDDHAMQFVREFAALQMAPLEKELNRTHGAIQRVRELHSDYFGACNVCITGGQAGKHTYQKYPCATIKALEGKDD